MGKKSKRRAADDDWEAASSSRTSEKPPVHVSLPPTCRPILPPGGASSKEAAVSGLVTAVATLLEDGEGDAMLLAAPIMTARECRAWIEWGEAIGFTIEKHAQTAYIAHRDNGRLAVESDEVAAAIFERLRPWLPAEVGGRKLRGCNPNIRLYRYAQGQRFGRHVDQANRLSGARGVTEATVLLYLNDEGLEGGETLFYSHHAAPEPLMRVAPKAGAALVHAHGARCLTHEGSEVRRGVKYLLRTDVAYA